MNHPFRPVSFFVLFFSFLLLLETAPLAGQQIDLQAFEKMSDAERYRFTQDLPFFSMNSAVVQQTLDLLLPIAEARGDRQATFVLKFKQFIEREKLHTTQEQILQNLVELESLAARSGWQVEQAVTHHYLFFQNFVNKKISFEQAYLEVGQAFERMEKLGFEQFQDYQADALLFHLGKFMWDLDDREKAVQFFSIAERFTQPTEAGSYHLTAILNHLQSYFQQKKDYPPVILLLLALAAWLNFKRLQAKRAEAAAATNELAALTRHFQEKSAVADTLRSELDRLASRDERNEQLEDLAHTTILIEEDWSRFRSLFEKVHPGFIEEQRRLHPELSAAELRLLVLEKLELGDQEFANLLGVSVKTVHQTRWRLHKKLGV